MRSPRLRGSTWRSIPRIDTPSHRFKRVQLIFLLSEKYFPLSLSYLYNINFKPKTFLRLKRIEAVYRYRQLMQKELNKNIRTKALSRKPRDIF